MSNHYLARERDSMSTDDIVPGTTLTEAEWSDLVARTGRPGWHSHVQGPAIDASRWAIVRNLLWQVKAHVPLAPAAEIAEGTCGHVWLTWHRWDTTVQYAEVMIGDSWMWAVTYRRSTKKPDLHEQVIETAGEVVTRLRAIFQDATDVGEEDGQ